MFNSKKSASLKTEVSKLVKLSNVQAGLPPIMRGLPVLAILAGEAAAKATNGGNKVEELMLGADEAILLVDPPKQPITMSEEVRPGVKIMCQLCAEGRTKNGKFIQLPERGTGTLGSENRWLSPSGWSR